ncbi:hypothetical protein DYB26_013408 [Aphanomyces astaci]|uniref:Uncharacterized protein n=1 Tax=Aphanomyces astaci TaxID=112090 RepID=A0A3R6ZRP4_APHAT|nr:hypothetical protein DYB26_013408 [Aphanomyces astaci]
MKTHKGPTAEEKKRVLDAFLRGDNWKLVAQHNDMSLATARRVVTTGRTTLLPRGGFRPAKSKVTPEIRAALEQYLDKNCQYTLREMQTFVAADFAGTELSVQTISRHILGMLYTVKQVDAARASLPCITQPLVVREVIFCQRNVEKAILLESMVYGQ